jgi:hypothetical protein
MKYLTVTVYSKLQVLELYNIKDILIAIKIIQNTGGDLQEIKIYGTNHFHYSERYISTIYKYCPFIKYISFFINNDNLNELEQLLINCQYLKAINVEILSCEDFDSNKFLNLLVNLAPISLYKIRISRKIFTIDSLSSFFKNWKGRKTLYLYNFIKDHHEVFEKYEKSGIIKYNHNNPFWVH